MPTDPPAPNADADDARPAGLDQGLENALDSALRFVERFGRTLFEALCHPCRLLHHLSGRGAHAPPPGRSSHVGPLTFLAVTWLLFGAVNNALLARLSPEQRSELDLPALLVHGMPLTEMLLLVLPVLLIVRIGAWLASPAGADAGAGRRLFAWNCYVVAIALVLALVVNASTLVPQPAPAWLALVTTLLPRSASRWVTFAVTVIYPALLLAWGGWRLCELDRHRRVVIYGPLAVASALAILTAELLSVYAAHNVRTAVERTRRAASMEIIGPIEVLARAGGPSAPERCRFVIGLNNKSQETLALDARACSVPKGHPGLSGLSIVDWSATNTHVLLLPPGQAAWIRFEETRQGHPRHLPLAVECRIGQSRLSQAFEGEEIASPAP